MIMDIKGQISRLIRQRRDGILLRSDANAVGSHSQVSVALRHFCLTGVIVRVGRGIYVTPQKLKLLGKEAVLERAQRRKIKLRTRLTSLGEKEDQALTPTARYVGNLAKRWGISYSPTYRDKWAQAVTRLAGDDVLSDATDDLLVALTHAGKLTPGEMVKLTMQHHRSLKSHV